MKPNPLHKKVDAWPGLLVVGGLLTFMTCRYFDEPILPPAKEETPLSSAQIASANIPPASSQKSYESPAEYSVYAKRLREALPTLSDAMSLVEVSQKRLAAGQSAAGIEAFSMFAEGLRSSFDKLRAIVPPDKVRADHEKLLRATKMCADEARLGLASLRDADTQAFRASMKTIAEASIITVNATESALKIADRYSL